jgi:hypothetical protein
MLIAGVANAQGMIAVQNGSSVSFYTQVIASVESAINGDTIIIPGGTWNIGNLSINKSIHLFGSGHNPDSAQANGYTLLNGNIILAQGCNNGSICGLYISGSINYNNESDIITHFSIKRCRINGFIHFSNNFSHGLITENYIGGGIDCRNISCGGCIRNNVFCNNIISSDIEWSSGNTISNNLFLTPTYNNGGPTVEYCLIENNIYLYGGNIMNAFSNCTFNNNLFVENYSFPFGTNLGFNNINNQLQESIFINQSGSTFSYSQDYHLKPTCPGKNAGTDGTDIGIYGGMFPWKDGSRPPNPHVIQKIIQQSTDENGNLNVNIKVSAQDR